MSDREAAARAEIARREAQARATGVQPWYGSESGWRIDVAWEDEAFIFGNNPKHVLGVLADARATLDQHQHGRGGVCAWCNGPRQPEPCPDKARVLNRYAPEES